VEVIHVMTQTPFPGPPGLDPNFVFGQLMPLLATVTIIIVGSLGLRWLFRTPVGEAIAERIRTARRWGAHAGPGGERAHAELESRVSHLQDQVGELAERLDFAERLLAERRERRVGPGE
jgi:hypothetical protein